MPRMIIGALSKRFILLKGNRGRKNLAFYFYFAIFLNIQTQAQDLNTIRSAKPFQMSGAVSVSGGPYFHFGQGLPRNSPFWWNISCSSTITIYYWSMPFSITLGPQQKTFSQPFNRYGISPHYKKLTLHAGYRSLYFNPYVLSGLQFLGGGIEFKPGLFRFAAFYGRFTRPVARDTNASIIPIPAYKRTGMGLKIGVGNNLNFIDFSFLKVTDDINSIPEIPITIGIGPRENFVGGLSTRISIGRHVTWTVDLAASLMNLDIRNEELEIKGVNDSPFLRNFFIPRIGSQFLLAGNSSLNFKFRKFGIKFNLKQVDPGYQSLGALFQQSDMRSYTIDPSVKLFKNKVRIGGSIGRQQDNIYGRKIFTSIRNIGSASLSINPSSKFGMDFQFSNYGIVQEAGLMSINDTFRIAQVNRNLNNSYRYSLQNKKRVLAFNLNVGYQELKDLNEFGLTSSSENQVYLVNVGNNYFRIRDNLNISGGINFNRNTSLFSKRFLAGPTIGIGKSFFKNKLKLNSSFTYNLQFIENNATGGIINFNGFINYQLKGGHQFNLNINFLSSSNPNGTSQNFSELRMMGGYVFSLNTRPKK